MRTFLAISVILVLCFVSTSAFATPGDSPDNPIIIRTATELDNVRNGLDRYYRLGNDIDLTAYLAPGGAGHAKWGTAGWLPIGNSIYNTDTGLYVGHFIGSFDGNGHKITGLWIDRSTMNGVGLFGYIENADIRNLGVNITGTGVKGHNYVGGLAGYQINGTITNSYTTGNVTGTNDLVGGLVGTYTVTNTNTSSIVNSYTTGNVSGRDIVGGLVGLFQGFYSASSIANSYATGNVSGGNNVGGLVGWQMNLSGIASYIIYSYATGNVDGSGYNIGGLVGYQNSDGANSANSTCIITNCYATGNVSGMEHSIGGLLGQQAAVNNSSCNITNSYATGYVSGGYRVGGLVGLQLAYHSSNSSITNSYTTGNVNGAYNVGGMVGFQYVDNNGNNLVTNSYTTGNVNGSYNIGGMVGFQEARDNGTNIISSNYRYLLATLNGMLIPAVSNDINGIHGGALIANQLINKATYTDNSWSFNDSTPPGQWIWDNRGFPKLNIGTENYPFQFDASMYVITFNTQPEANIVVTEGNISSSLSVIASTSSSLTLNYQWYSNTNNSNTGGTLIINATNSSFTIPNTLTAGTYYYYCIVSAINCVSVTSNTAVVTVNHPFVPVTDITGVPTSTVAGTALTLTGTVVPSNATNKTISWSVKEAATTGAVITGDTLHTTADGITVITATIADGAAVGTDHTQDFSITVTKVEPDKGGIPTYPDKNKVLDKTGMDTNNLEERNGKVYLSKNFTKELLKTDDIETNILPVFEVKVTPNGDVAAVSFTIIGSDLLAQYPNKVNLIGMITKNAGILLDYVVSKSGNDGEFTLLFGGAVFDGEIVSGDEYELLVFIKDGGIFDLDGLADGEIIASLYFASEKTGDGGKGGGCNAASYGHLAFAILTLLCLCKSCSFGQGGIQL